MATDWDADDFEVPSISPIITASKYADEDAEDAVKDSWEDVEPEAAPKPASKPAKKVKAKTAEKGENNHDDVGLTEQEKRAMQEASQLQLVADLFGGGGLDASCDSADGAEQLAAAVSDKLRLLKDGEFYAKFLEKLFTDVSIGLDSKRLRELSQSLSVLATAQLSEEKEGKGKKAGKRRPQIGASGKSTRGDVFDDFGGDMGGGGELDPVDDFM